MCAYSAGDCVRVVIKLTGRLFSYDNISLLKEYSRLIVDRFLHGFKFAIVCGGGPIARSYISMARGLGLGEGWYDRLGIEVSRVNALILNALLGDVAYNTIPRSVDEFLMAWSSGKVVTLGGLQPGQSTNAVAAVIAELIRANLLINASDVDGIYDRDPKKDPNARLLPRVTVGELRTILSNQSVRAGGYELLDPLALLVIERSCINTVFVNAFKIDHVKAALDGAEVGTKVICSE